MDDLLQRAKTEQAPLIDGDRVTFIWQGENAPFLAGDFTHWNPANAIKLAKSGPNLWTHSFTIAPDAYLEYAYFADPADDTTRMIDPLNPRQIDNGIGQKNHYFAMPGCQHTTFIEPITATTADAKAGTVTAHTLPEMDQRTLWLYQPPVAEPVPLLLVYDGRNYIEDARLPHIVDHLIAQGAIQPIAMALIDNAGAENRFTEYAASEAMLYAVLEEILPLVRQHLNLIPPDSATDPTRGPYGVLGASMGGLMALYTGLRLPHIFGRIISQSGAFFPNLDPKSEMLIYTLVRQTSTLPLKLWLDVGLYEGLLEDNRTMRRLLRLKRYDLLYKEVSTGHNWTSWRDLLPEALMALFPAADG